MALDEASVLGVTPLFPEETEEAIGERYEQWANEGLTPDDADQWVDVRPGSYWYLNTRPCIRQDARLYDVMGTDYVSAAIPFLAWGEYLDDHASGQKVFRNPATAAKGSVTFTGEAGTEIDAGTVVAVEGPAEQVEGKEYQVTEAGVIPEGGSITLPVEALVAGAAGDAPTAAVTLLQSELSGVTAITNAEAILGGADPEDDESLRERLIEAKDGEGPGSVQDYKVWSRAFSAEIGRVVVIPLWEGPGTVLVVVLSAEGDPISKATVDALQTFLDPIAAKGEGQAPVGPTVIVKTAESVNVAIEAEVEFEQGFSLDGALGTVSLRLAVEEAISTAISAAQPGDEVVLQRVVAAIMSVVGVHDVGGVKLNAKAENIALGSNPPQVAEVSAIALEEAEL